MFREKMTLARKKTIFTYLKKKKKTERKENKCTHNEQFCFLYYIY